MSPTDAEELSQNSVGDAKSTNGIPSVGPENVDVTTAPLMLRLISIFPSAKNRQNSSTTSPYAAPGVRAATFWFPPAGPVLDCQLKRWFAVCPWFPEPVNSRRLGRLIPASVNM